MINTIILLQVTKSGKKQREERTARATGEETGQEVMEGLPGRDALAMDLLQRHWLQAPSLLPYNLTGSGSYLSAAKGDTWTFVHHYVTWLFEGNFSGDGW